LPIFTTEYYPSEAIFEDITRHPAGIPCLPNFSATGITDGQLLKGIRHTSFGAISQSLVVRGRSKTVRIIETEHRSI